VSTRSWSPSAAINTSPTCPHARTTRVLEVLLPVADEEEDEEEEDEEEAVPAPAAAADTDGVEEVERDDTILARAERIPSSCKNGWKRIKDDAAGAETAEDRTAPRTSWIDMPRAPALRKYRVRS
jgi:hypothetical protein